MIVLYNANILSFDPAQPKASALVIDRGHILYIGNDDAALSMASSSSARQNMHQKTIMPGLTDSHVHLEYFSLNLERIDCATHSVEECLEKIRERASNLQPGAWIMGHGWNQNDWSGDYSWAAGLDAVSPKNPVYLTHKSYHSGWANTLALKSAGISRESLDPEGGAILKDSSGNPNGILLEDACLLLQKAIPQPSDEQVQAAILKAQPILWQMGLTGVHDFDRRSCFSALQGLHLSGRLKLRVTKSLPLESLEHAETIGLRSGFGDDMLRIGAIKIFADGALGSKTAAMAAPYENELENYGMLLLDEAQVFEIGKTAVNAGFALAVHAIGDLANHHVLNAFERLRLYENSHGLPARRHRIEHVQILNLRDVGRLAALDLIASMQPTHILSDMETASHYWGERCQYGYALKSIQDSGAVLALGSDAPVEIPNPFHGIHAAVTRHRPDGFPGPQGWYPQERLSQRVAFAGFITGPAFASGMERHLGRISPGFLADLIVLPEDPFSIPPNMLRELLPDSVMVGGEWVYSI